MPIYSNKEYVKLMRPLPDYVARDIYQIPFVEADQIDISPINNGKWLINLKNCSVKDRNAKHKIVQSFCYDESLIREFNSPYKFLSKVGSYEAVATFDFSMDEKMTFVQILEATYNNRWIGAFLQANGKKVIPTVGWVGPEYYDVTFAGLRNGGVFMISTLGANNSKSYESFIGGYSEMRLRFPDTRIICVGDKINGMDSDVCFVKYEDSFGSWDRHNNFWQPKFFNWDMTWALGGIDNVI